MYDPAQGEWQIIGEFVDHRAVADAVVLNEQVYILGGKGNDGFSDSVFAAELPLIPSKILYFKDGNATDQVGHSAHQLRPDHITLNMLSTEVLGLLDVSRTHGQLEGSLLAVPQDEQPPPGYTLYESSDGNGSLVWKEKAPVSVARYAYDGVESLGGKIYFVGGAYPPSNLVERFDPATESWESLPNLTFPRIGVATAVANDKLYAIGGEEKRS